MVVPLSSIALVVPPVTEKAPAPVMRPTSAAAEPAVMFLKTRSKTSAPEETFVVTDSMTLPVSLLPAAVSVMNSAPAPIPAAGVPLEVVRLTVREFKTVSAAESSFVVVTPADAVTAPVAATVLPAVTAPSIAAAPVHSKVVI